MDSDDVWHQDKLQEQISLVKNSGVKFCHTGERWIRDGKEMSYPKRLKKPYGWCFDKLLDSCKIAASSVLIDKSIFEKVGLFDEDLRYCEDYEFWLRVSSSFKIGLADKPLITKYAGHSQLSNEIKMIDKTHIEILLNYLNSRHKDEVRKTIQKKLEILKKGALKRNNFEMLKWCKDIDSIIS